MIINFISLFKLAGFAYIFTKICVLSWGRVAWRVLIKLLVDGPPIADEILKIN